MCGHDQLLHPPAQTSRSGRRRSADIGGLSLATRSGGTGGQGWLGHASGEQIQTRFAELLSDMYTQTLNAVNEHFHADVIPDIPPETRKNLIAALDGWGFEPGALPDEDHVAACAIIFFEALFRIEGMPAAVGVSLAQIPPFIQHLRHIYRWQNSYHNFEHALDVLQATYCYLRATDMVPPLSILLEGNENETWVPPRAFDSGPLITVLSREDLFVLAIAAIGHDVGHPGFTNLFMANAAAPLSTVFDGQSPLEQLHCALLMRVMRAHGMGALLDGGAGVNVNSKSASTAPRGGRDGKSMRRLLSDIVLATDMRVHDAFMKRYTELIAGGGESGLAYRRTTLCQAIIKCADISNPSRPYYISKYWAALLLREWNAQAALEKHHHLSVTVEASDHPLREASSQMFFIPAFVKPLLELVMQGVPEMQPYAAQCDLNLKLWTARLAILKAAGDASNAAGRFTSKTQPSGNSTDTNASENDKTEPYEDDPRPRYSGAFPLALPPAHFPHGHFNWATASAPAYSPSSPRVPPTSRPPSSFSMAQPTSSPSPCVQPASLSSAGSSTSTHRCRRENAGSSESRPTSTFSAAPSSSEEGDAESMSEASFAAFSPSSRASSTTSASPGVMHCEARCGSGENENENEHVNDGESGSSHNEGESEYATAWNGSESGRSGVEAGDRDRDKADGAALDMDGTSAIRAAARLAGLKPFGSLRHAPHRNSWSPAMRDEWVAQLQMSAAGVS